MAKQLNTSTMESIKTLNAKGLNDGEIAKILNIRSNLVNHYRHRIMKLKPNWLKRDYKTDQDRLAGYIIRQVKGSALRRGIPFDIDFYDLILPEYCPILKIKLIYNYRDGTPKEINSFYEPSVDRIDNTKGYVRGNVWIISRLANSMKNAATLEQLELFCINMQVAIKNHRALGGMTDLISLGL